MTKKCGLMIRPEPFDWSNYLKDGNQEVPNGYLKDKGVHKARLVVLGNFPKQGIDHQETFSPVVRYESLRMVSAIAVQQGLVIKQMDDTTAILNGK